MKTKKPKVTQSAKAETVEACSVDKKCCKKLLLGIVAAALVLLAGYVTLESCGYIKSNNVKQIAKYAPFAFADDESLDSLEKIESATIMEGTENNNLLVAHPNGSKIFPKSGLNYVIASEGGDEFYYSLCNTDVIDDQVGVIEGFDPKQDKLVLFCAHHKISPKDIEITHVQIEEDDVTFVEIKGKHKISAIALLGNIDIKVEDIVLNQRWESK